MQDDVLRVKSYVAVEVYYTPEGAILPQAVEWPDGRHFWVEELREPCPRKSSVGSAGILYECRICGQWRKLFYEDPAWFVEKKVKAAV